MSDALLFEHAPQVLSQSFHGVFNCPVRFHLQHQVHAALQIESEVDRFMRPQLRFDGRQQIHRGGCHHNHRQD